MPAVPRCEKSDRNIGLVRVTLFVVLPLMLGLMLSLLLHWCVERQRKKWINQYLLGDRSRPGSRPTTGSPSRGGTPSGDSKYRAPPTRTQVAPVAAITECATEDLGIGQQPAVQMTGTEPPPQESAEPAPRKKLTI
jgi:hypothetical protein